MQPGDTLDPGSSVGGFVLGALLGSGGFGAVYRARDGDGRQVALKISHPGRLAGRMATQQVIRQQNEIEALARLSHPSLVKVHRYGFTADARFFLAMELVEGVRLDHYLAQRRRLDVIEAIQIMRKVAETVAYCHAQSVLHLDLKPENIMLTAPHEPRLKVLDFGLAHLRGEGLPRVPAAARGGTLAYMAPEYFLPGGMPSPDPRLDLYALGTIFYELLSGSLTHDAGSINQLAHFKLQTDPRPVGELVPSLPAPVAALVHALLARQPAARLGSAAQLAGQLKDLYYATLAGAPAASEPGPPAPAPPPASADWQVAATGADAAVPLVGRAAELEALRGELAACAEGAIRARGRSKGRSVLVVGEAGLGKSRLVAEAVRRWGAGDGVTLCGRCRQLGELVPYSPLREALGQIAYLLRHAPERRTAALRAALAAEAVVLGSLVPELYEALPPPSGCGEAQPAGEAATGGIADLAAYRLAGAERVARALAGLLAALGVPLVLVLEDVHWADEGTLAVISRLLASGLPDGVLLLATSRPADALAGIGPCRVMRLPPLSPGENDELLRSLVGRADDALPARLKQSIPLLSAGNPLFVTQVVRNLEAEGYVVRSAQGNATLSTRELALYEPPDSVSTVLRRALRRLPAAVLEVLAAAALMGREFSAADLRRLGLFAAGGVDAALAESERQCLCRISPDGSTGTFVHEAIREQLEGSVPPEQLPEMHARIAGQLQRRGAPAGTLGRHLEQAGAPGAAADAYFQAGLDAERLHDPRGARRHLERAFRLLAGAEMAPRAERDTLLARTTYHLVRVGCALGDTAETLRYLDDCAARLAGTRAPEQVAALESSYARLAYVQGQLPGALQHGARCLDTVLDDPSLGAYQCFPSNVIGRARCISGRFGEATALLGRGCELARETGEYAELSHSAGLLAAAQAYCGNFSGAERNVEISSDFARRLGDPLRIMGALVYRAAISEARGDWDQGVRQTTALLAFAEEHGIGGLYLYVGTTMTGRHQFHVGNLGRARVLLANALNLSQLLRMAPVRSWTNAFLGDVHLVSGDGEAARAQYLEGLELARSMGGDEHAEPQCLIGLAHLEALAGTAPVARVCALGDEAVQRLREAGNVTTLVTVLQRYALALEALGDDRGARARLDERHALIERLGLPACDFWPRIPVQAGGGARADAREYWRLHARAAALATAGAPGGKGGNRATFMTVSTVQGTAAPRPANEADWLESLATIEGFVPPL